MAKTKLAVVPETRNRPAVKNRKTHPYVVFQIEKALKARMARKIKGKKSMSAFVEDLIRKAV